MPAPAGDAIAVLATLDTKGPEVAFVRDRLSTLGRRAIVLDIGTAGSPTTTPDVPRDEIARRGGPSSLPSCATPAEALAIMGVGARAVLDDLFRDGTVSGVIGIGGGKGSAAFADAIRNLPFGLPKVLVSSARPNLLAQIARDSDTVLFPTLVDLFGVNGFTERILDNASRAIAAMVWRPRPASARKVVAVTAFGVTTPAANRCARLLEEVGVEPLVFPANGAGGRMMERLIADGEIDAVIDLTTTELADELMGGTASAGSNRLTAAGQRGIPQFVAPGAVDMVNFGVRDSIPARYRDRIFFQHTAFTTLMRTTAEENAQIGALTAERLALGRGPRRVVWPARGVSDYDRPGGPFHDPDADRAWFEAVRSGLPADVECLELDCHINDPAFASAAVDWILAQVHGPETPR